MVNPSFSFAISIGSIRSREVLKIGVLFVGKDQDSMSAILQNQSTSPAFEGFLESLGWNVCLRRLVFVRADLIHEPLPLFVWGCVVCADLFFFLMEFGGCTGECCGHGQTCGESPVS